MSDTQRMDAVIEKLRRTANIAEAAGKDGWAKAIRNGIEELAAKEEQIAALRKDAERYRWLRDTKEYPGYVYDALACRTDHDRAIDAAIATEKKEGA